MDQYEVTQSYEPDEKFVAEYRRLDVLAEEAKCRYRAVARGSNPDVEAMIEHSLKADEIQRQMDDLGMEFCKKILQIMEIPFSKLGGFSISASGRLVQINVLYTEKDGWSG